MTDENPTIQNLLVSNPLREPLLQSVIGALQLPRGSRGLDVGCGIGLQALLLAEAVGESGHVTGVDIAPDLLAYAENLAAQRGVASRITFRQGDARRLPFGNDEFDWAWSADCIGYPLGELAPMLDELKRVVRPGGSIVLLGWTSQQVLPGYPLLEARLNAECSAYLPYLKGQDPELNFLRAPRSMEAAGLQDVTAHSIVGDVQAPLGGPERDALAALFGMLWAEPIASESGALAADWREMQRLCRPESPDFIAARPGYYGFFTYTVFRATVP